MIAILDDLREAVNDLRSAVLDRDITRIQRNTKSISDIVQKLSEYSPDALTEEDRRSVKELVRITSDTNQLLSVQLDYTKLALESIQRKKEATQNWYA